MEAQFMGKVIALWASALFGWSAAAASYQGTVQNVTPNNGKVYVRVVNGYFDGATSACASSGTMIYAIDPSTPFGRSLVAVALAAKLTSTLVYAIGDGVCVGGAPYGNGEGLVGLDLKG